MSVCRLCKTRSNDFFDKVAESTYNCRPTDRKKGNICFSNLQFNISNPYFYNMNYYANGKTIGEEASKPFDRFIVIFEVGQ